ncbi:MAG TPA: biotin/lipoyl-containing protein [Blastocatellia bacterium]|nr:biotin/lipoyl-containing protein [Blastocatellia bacterium]
MKYEAEIDGNHVSIEMEERNGRLSATIGGRNYDVEIERPEEGVYLIFAGDNVYEARVSSVEANSMRVKLRDRVFTASIIDRKHRRAGTEHAGEGRHDLIAPMPGKVVRVLLAPGDEVAAGQGVVVVEAMKMQNEIKSPKRGHVAEVRVTEGATVIANQILAVVE